MRSSSLPSASVFWLMWLRSASSLRVSTSVMSTHRLRVGEAIIQTSSTVHGS